MPDDRSWWQFRSQKAETDLSDKKAALKGEHDARDGAEAEKDRAAALGDKPGEAKAKDEQEKHERRGKDIETQVSKAGEELEMSRDGEAKAFTAEELKLAGAQETSGPTSATEMNAPQAEGGGYRVEDPLKPGSFMDRQDKAETGSTSPSSGWAAKNQEALQRVNATLQQYGAQQLSNRDAPPVQEIGSQQRPVGELELNAGIGSWDAQRKQPPQPAMTPAEVQEKLGPELAAQARQAGRKIAPPTPEPSPEIEPEL